MVAIILPRFILDENLPLFFARDLESVGFNVITVREQMPGTSDTEIVELSAKENRVIITRDKDFGFLVYSQNLRPAGVILIRLKDQSKKPLKNSSMELTKLAKSKEELLGKFIIFDGKILRDRPI